MLTYVLSVPVERNDEYTTHGWAFRGMDNDNPGHVLLEKTVLSQGIGEPEITYLAGPVTPTLIQRADIRRPLGKFRDVRFFDSVSLHHMGSDIFALGVNASLRRMYHMRFAFDLFKAENLYIKKDDRSYALRLYTRFRGPELERYVNWLLLLRERKLKLAKPSGFTRDDVPAGSLPHSPDLWWDVVNDVIFSFDKNYMARLAGHMDVSFSLIEGNYVSGHIRRAD